MLAPLIFRRTVNVNPLVVTLSILFLGEIAGIMGAIIAVPVVATLADRAARGAAHPARAARLRAAARRRS